MFVSAVNQLITQKDAIIAALTVSLDTAFDLAGLKAEQAEVESEMAVDSALIEKCMKPWTRPFVASSLAGQPSKPALPLLQKPTWWTPLTPPFGAD